MYVFWLIDCVGLFIGRVNDLFDDFFVSCMEIKLDVAYLAMPRPIHVDVGLLVGLLSKPCPLLDTELNPLRRPIRVFLLHQDTNLLLYDSQQYTLFCHELHNPQAVSFFTSFCIGNCIIYIISSWWLYFFKFIYIFYNLNELIMCILCFVNCISYQEKGLDSICVHIEYIHHNG